MTGKKVWIIPDGYLPVKSTGEQPSHEAICVLNLTDHDAKIFLTFYFEDREPFDDFETYCGAQRTHHIRLDRLFSRSGQRVPRGLPYAIKLASDVPVVVQHSRLDSSQEALALFTTMGYSE